MPLLVSNLISSATETVRAGSGYAVDALTSLVYPATPATLLAIRLIIELKLDGAMVIALSVNTQQDDKVVSTESALEAKAVTELPALLSSQLTPFLSAQQTAPIFVKCVLRVPNPEEREIHHDTYPVATLLEGLANRVMPFLNFYQTRLRPQRVRHALDQLFHALYTLEYYPLGKVEAQQLLNLFLSGSHVQQLKQSIGQDAQLVTVKPDDKESSIHQVFLDVQYDESQLPVSVRARYRHTTYALDLRLLTELQQAFHQRQLPAANFPSSFERVNRVAEEVSQLGSAIEGKSLEAIEQLTQLYCKKWDGTISLHYTLDEAARACLFTVNSSDGLIALRLSVTMATLTASPGR